MPAEMVCVICLTPGTEFRHCADQEETVIVEALGFQADDNLCPRCHRMIVDRKNVVMAQSDSMRFSRQLSTQDVSSLPASTQSQPQPSVRLSELPIVSSPARSSSRSSSSVFLDDTVDRLVKKKPRVDKALVEVAASQSLSLDEANISSQNQTVISRRQSSQRPPVTKNNSPVITDDSSLSEELQIPPLPKNRRTRPGPKQFATGTLEFPSYINTHVVSTDLPRVAAG